MSAALATIEQEGAALIRSLAARRPAKELARRTGLTPRHVYNLRDGECQPRWASFIALAQECPELKSAVARWLGLAPGPESAALREKLEKLLAETSSQGR